MENVNERLADNLKPCPFCGGIAEMIVKKHIPTGYEYTPRCMKTACAGRLTKKWLDEYDAYIAWNRRVDDAEPGISD